MTPTLRSAAQAVLDRWDSPQWEWTKHGPTADLMHALRVALAQPVPDSAIYAATSERISPDWHAGFRAGMDAGKACAATAHPQPAPLTPRELELIDGMIQVQLHHAAQCDGMLAREGANHRMAEKQKGWDMERVALLRKLAGIVPAPTTGEGQ